MVKRFGGDKVWRSMLLHMKMLSFLMMMIKVEGSLCSVHDIHCNFLEIAPFVMTLSIDDEG